MEVLVLVRGLSSLQVFAPFSALLLHPWYRAAEPPRVSGLVRGQT